MSLTRDEWIQMWYSIKRIEGYIDFKPPSLNKNGIQKDVELIKEKIQSVVGQME